MTGRAIHTHAAGDGHATPDRMATPCPSTLTYTGDRIVIVQCEKQRGHDGIHLGYNRVWSAGPPWYPMKGERHEW